MSPSPRLSTTCRRSRKRFCRASSRCELVAPRAGYGVVTRPGCRYRCAVGTHVYAARVVIPASPDVVFWDLLEPAHVPQYDSHFRSWVPRDRPPRVGTRVDFTAKVFGMWSKGTSEFTAFDPPRHLALRLVKPSGPLHSRVTWDLSDTDGGTSFAYRFEITTPRGLGWLAKTLLAQFTSHLDAELPALARRHS